MHRISILVALILLIFYSTSANAGRSILVVNDLAPDGVEAKDARVITNLLRGQMVKSGRFTVVERAEMEKIADEIEFQMSDCTDVSCAVEFGQMLNADKMVVGTVAEFMGQMIITARIVDLAKAAVEFEESVEAIKQPREMKNAIDQLGEKLASRIPLIVTVVANKEGTFYLDSGTRDGIFIGQKLIMLREDIVRDPSGRAIMRSDKRTGELEVIYTTPKTSKGKKIQGSIKAGDFYRLEIIEKRLAQANPDNEKGTEAKNPPRTPTETMEATYTDTKTGLMWQREDDGIKRGEYGAENYCRDLELGGFDNWKLPSKKELLSIADTTKKNPAIDLSIFPSTKAEEYWTRSAGIHSRFLNVNFYDGYVSNSYGELEPGPFLVRCVRDK